MPGSSESPSDAPSKAKVTSATTNGGIFVRPVAVAGIFCPVAESDNKPPVLPEKRRFSALVGDLRPCSSGGGAATDDFNRRRQSWDTRQKEAPFSQAILRKTPRNNTNTSLKSEDTKCETSTATVTITNKSVGIISLPSVGNHESPSRVPNQSQALNESIPNTGSDDISKLKLYSNSEKLVYKKEQNTEGKKLVSNGITDAKSNVVTNSKTVATSISSISTSTVPGSKISSISNLEKNNLDIKSTVENKQPKKVYGLIKRESKSDISNNQKDTSKEFKSDSSNTYKNIVADSKTEISITQKAIKKESKPEPSNNKNGIDKKPLTEISDSQKDRAVSSKDSEIASSKKVYGVNKNYFKKDSAIRPQDNLVQLKSSTENSSSSSTELQKTHESKNIEIYQEKQTDNSRSSVSPPKDFRTVRRTSDVIAAKIQNIFSNFQSDKTNQSTPRKSVTLVKKEIASVLNSQTKTADVEVKKTFQSKESPPIETFLKQQAKTVTETNQITKTNSIKPNELDSQKNAKPSAGDKTQNSNKNRCEVAVSSDKVSPPSHQKKEVINIQSLKVNTSPVVVATKTECSTNSLSSQPQDKNVADIEGKMPIKKADQNISGVAKSSSVFTNGNTDRLSSEPSALLRIVEENANKRSEVFKKQIMPAKNSVTDLGSERGVSSSTKTSVMRVTNSSDSKANKTHKFESVESHSHSVVSSFSSSTTATSQTCIVSDSIQKTSYSNSSTVSKEFLLNSKTVLNGIAQTPEVSAVEVTKITPTTTPGIVPTVNVLFRTKSPQSAQNRDENRKKVVIETNTANEPVSSAVVIPLVPSTEATSYNCAKESVKEALKAVENVQKSLNSSPAVPKKHSILNLKNEELVTVSLASSSKESESKCVSSSGTTDKLSSPFPISSPAGPSNIESKATAINSKSELVSKCSMNSHSNSLSALTKDESDTIKSVSSETKTSVVDLSEWSKKFQSSDLDAPRAPLRRRFLRDSLPPSLPSRSVSVSRYGSLKRIEDPPRYIPRSPSQSIIPQRYSYTEMLSKVCSMGVLPYTEPINSKSCSSSSSQVSELWSELSEEQSTATHASEMLEAETSERMRLEKEVHELQNRYSQVQQRSDKMEMEMMENRMFRSPEINGDLSDEDETDGKSSIYRQKYERAVRDMEIMKRRIQQQQEEEMEQKAMMKKASEKRLAEALEDVEEERQVANQWKRKAQKLGAELQDLRLMLEEQMGRNGELEKKQRKFDAELSSAQEEIKKERMLRDKLMREKDQAISEKYTLEQELQTVKMDSDMLHEKISQLNRELDELTLSSKGEEEVTQLKRTKQELERKTRDQEEELEELAAQVQMLEQAKLRLEMSLEKVRQEHRRETSVREEEIEEIRASFSKKIKNLEAQLESEQDERHQLMKQKHELERRIYELADQPPPQDPEIERRLRRDLKRTKALLRDAQSMLEHTREGQSSKTLIRQLKNQLEDSEFAKVTAVKARQAIEAELQECQSQLEEVTRVKNEAESRCLQLSREKSAIQTQLEEAEEEMAEVMKKYKAAVAQMSIDQKSLAEQNQQIAELESERQMLKDQLSEVSHKFEHLAGQSDDTHKVHWLDSKIRDLESKLELEQTTKTRLENQIARLKEQNDRSREECDSLRNKEMQAQEGVRRLQRQVRDLREDYAALQQKEADAYRKQHELEMALENTETDLQVTKNDLRLACQRIQDLQNALEDDLDSGTDVPDDSGSDSEDSFDLSVLRNQSVTPVQRCDSVASNLSYCTTEDIRSRTSSFSRELSAFSSRDDVEKDVNGLSGVSSRGHNIEADETV